MRDLQQGDTFFSTQSTELAAILTALDFEFFDKERPADVRVKNGKEVTTWMFNTSCVNGDRQALDIYKAYKNAEKTVKENPTDPISYTIAAVKNLSVFNKAVKEAKPLHGFKIGKHTLWVTEEDSRYKKLTEDPRAKKL